MRVRTKLLLLSAVPLVGILFISVFFSISQNSTIREMKNTLYSEGYEGANLMLNADRDMYQALSAFQEIIKPGISQDSVAGLKASFDENQSQALERVAGAAEALKADEALWGSETHEVSGLNIFQSFDMFLQRFAAWVEKAEQTLSSGAEIADFSSSELCAEFESVRDYLDQAQDILNSVMTRQVAELEKKAAQAAMVNYVVGALTIAAVFALALYIIASITKPLKKTGELIQSMAEGDLSRRLDESSKDEFGQMARMMNRLAESLSGTIGGILAASEQVASGARQLSASGSSLAAGASTQASSVEELSASLEQLSAQTEQNSGNAQKASELSKSVKAKAEEGNEYMASMLRAMSGINESSANISKIIKVIDEIAFQTNILSLNAAVEAARAGQHGKGFAVVAEEVRNLAARSAEAAKETTSLIEGSISRVEEGTEIANKTAGALAEIVEGVSEAARLAEEIARSSQEQASGISQINAGVSQISKVVQENSATAEESSAASEELLQQAESLRNSVAIFKLKSDQQPA